MRVQGLGFRIEGLGFKGELGRMGVDRAEGSGLKERDFKSSGFRGIQGPGFWGSELGAQDSRIQSPGLDRSVRSQVQGLPIASDRVLKNMAPDPDSHPKP